VLDHDPRSAFKPWGIHLVASLGSQIEVGFLLFLFLFFFTSPAVLRVFAPAALK